MINQNSTSTGFWLFLYFLWFRVSFGFQQAQTNWAYNIFGFLVAFFNCSIFSCFISKTLNAAVKYFVLSSVAALNSVSRTKTIPIYTMMYYLIINGTEFKMKLEMCLEDTDASTFPPLIQNVHNNCNCIHTTNSKFTFNYIHVDIYTWILIIIYGCSCYTQVASFDLIKGNNSFHYCNNPYNFTQCTP